MAIERLIRRIAHQALCKCGWKDIKTKNPPRETQCPDCKAWVPYEEVSWTGSENYIKPK